MRFSVLWLLLAVLLLSGCVPPSQRGATTGPAGNLPPTELATVLKPTPIDTPIPPVPDTLTTAELLIRLDPFTALDCALPCYNGLTPGQGDLQAALLFYSKLGISALDTIPGDYQAVQSDGTGHLGAALIRTSDIVDAANAGYKPPRVDVLLQANSVRTIYVVWEEYPDFLTLPRIVEKMGAPDQLSVGLVFAQNPPLYAVQLSYVDERTGFLFIGSTRDSSPLEVCLSKDHVLNTLFGVFAPESELMGDTSYKIFLLPFEQSTGVLAADFFNTVAAGGCLSIPSEKWAQWQSLGQ